MHREFSFLHYRVACHKDQGWKNTPYLPNVFVELDSHLEQDLVLIDPGLEALVDLEKLIDNLLFLALSVSLCRQHLCCFQMFLYLCLRLLMVNDKYQGVNETGFIYIINFQLKKKSDKFLVRS